MSAGLDGADVRGAAPGTGDLAVIVLHGRDQDPDWMYDHVVDALAARLSGPAVTWVAPTAPGRAWYAGRVHDPLPTTRAERDAAADTVDRLAADLAAVGHDPGSIVLAGFSQGACLVADHLLRRPRSWAGALIWTGAAFGPPGTPWPATGDRPLAGVPVLATNGDDDPWVPLTATEELVAILRTHGADVTTHVEPGRAHEVADGEIERAAELLRRAVRGPSGESLPR